MNYFLVTTSISDSLSMTRKLEYISGITQLINAIIQNEITNYKVIIIENNGFNKKTFLDDLILLLPDSVEVFHTNNNNNIITNNKGVKELQDILDCINHHNINDDDFIVKMTGRYYVSTTSELFKQLKTQKYDCILRYGSFINPVNYKMNDCITGFICMKCKYIKMIEIPNEKEAVEWKWGKVSMTISDEKIFIVNHLNMMMKPSCGNITYFI